MGQHSLNPEILGSIVIVLRGLPAEVNLYWNTVIKSESCLMNRQGFDFRQGSSGKITQYAYPGFKVDQVSRSVYLQYGPSGAKQTAPANQALCRARPTREGKKKSTYFCATRDQSQTTLKSSGQNNSFPLGRGKQKQKGRERWSRDHLKGPSGSFILPEFSYAQRMRVPRTQGTGPRPFVFMKEGGLLGKRAVNISPGFQGNFENNLVQTFQNVPQIMKAGQRERLLGNPSRLSKT